MVRAKLICSFLLPSLTLDVLLSSPGGFSIVTAQRKRGHLNHDERTCCSHWNGVLLGGSSKAAHCTKLKAWVTSQGKNMAPAGVPPHLQGLEKAWPFVPPLGSPDSPGIVVKIKGECRCVLWDSSGSCESRRKQLVFLWWKGGSVGGGDAFD